MDWKRKLTSRKFWSALATFIAGVVIACHGSEETATQVTALIMAGAAVIAYIIGEGLTDAAHADDGITVVLPNEEDAEKEKE